MKASELIAQLQALVDQHGDLEVFTTESCNRSFTSAEDAMRWKPSWEDTEEVRYEPLDEVRFQIY